MGRAYRLTSFLLHRHEAHPVPLPFSSIVTKRMIFHHLLRYPLSLRPYAERHGNGRHPGLAFSAPRDLATPPPLDPAGRPAWLYVNFAVRNVSAARGFSGDAARAAVMAWARRAAALAPGDVTLREGKVDQASSQPAAAPAASSCFLHAKPYSADHSCWFGGSLVLYKALVLPRDRVWNVLHPHRASNLPRAHRPCSGRRWRGTASRCARPATDSTPTASTRRCSSARSRSPPPFAPPHPDSLSFPYAAIPPSHPLGVSRALNRQALM